MNPSECPALAVHYDEVGADLDALAVSIPHIEANGTVDPHCMNVWCKDRIRLRPATAERILLFDVVVLGKLNEEEESRPPEQPYPSGSAYEDRITQIPKSFLPPRLFWEPSRPEPPVVPGRKWNPPRWFVAMQKTRAHEEEQNPWCFYLARLGVANPRTMARAPIWIRALDVANGTLAVHMPKMARISKRINSLLSDTGNDQTADPDCHVGHAPRLEPGRYSEPQRLTGSVVCDLLRLFVLNPVRFWEHTGPEMQTFSQYNPWPIQWQLYCHMVTRYEIMASMSLLNKAGEMVVKWTNEAGLLEGDAGIDEKRRAWLEERDFDKLLTRPKRLKRDIQTSRDFVSKTWNGIRRWVKKNLPANDEGEQGHGEFLGEPGCWMQQVRKHCGKKDWFPAQVARACTAMAEWRDSILNSCSRYPAGDIDAHS